VREAWHWKNGWLLLPSDMMLEEEKMITINQLGLH